MEPDGIYNPAKRPVTPVKTSWFEFLLDATLLEKHLNKESPDPTASDLIALFLYQADVAASTAKEIKDEEVLTEIPENKKVKSLKLLALKVAAHLHWNLDDLNKRIPLAMVQDILLELLKICLNESDADPAKHANLNLTTLPHHALFALQLYHRWCLKVLVEETFPHRPNKTQAVQVPGLEVPVLNPANGKETVMNIVKEGQACSLSVLQSFLSMATDVTMPTLASLGFVLHDADTVEYQWDQGLVIPSSEMVAQISFDLGSVHFFSQNYKQAFYLFTQAQETLSQLSSAPSPPLYSSVDAACLRGFLQACQAMSGNMPAHQMGLYERAEETKKNKCVDLVSVLLEDNQKMELGLPYRDTLEEHVLDVFGKVAMYREVHLCNTLRKAVQGQIHSPQALRMLSSHGNLRKFTLKCLESILPGLSHGQKENLTLFVKYMRLKLASESSFCEGLKRVMFGKVDVDWGEASAEKRPLVLDTEEKGGTSEQSQIERQLLTTYDPATIKELVQKLLNKMSKNYILGLTDQWRIPRELGHPIESLPIPWVQVYSYVLIAKSRVCVRLQLYPTAKLLLQAADNTIRDISYKLGKLLRWELLRIDLLHQQHTTRQGGAKKEAEPKGGGGGASGKKGMTDSGGGGTNRQDVIKKAKSCLATMEGKHDMLPGGDVLSSAVAFLVNSREWEYLQGLTTVNNGWVQMGRLVVKVCTTFTAEGPSYSQASAKKAAKELWEAVTEIYTASTQQKRTGSGSVTNLQRESTKGMLSTQAFLDLVSKLQDEVALTAILSCLLNFWRMVKTDINTDIQIEYQSLWPTSLPNVSSVLVPVLTNAISTLVELCREVNPVQLSWLQTQADLCFVLGAHSEAMKHYLELGMLNSDGFSEQVMRSVYDDQTLKKIIRCCSQLNYHGQVVVLCQCLEEIDYSTAFKALQESRADDAMDTYLSYLWDNTLLEYIINLHHRRGETHKKQLAIQTIGQLELNSSNPPEVLVEAARKRKAKFLRTLAKQYL